MRYRKEISDLFGKHFIDVIKQLITRRSLTKANIEDISDEMKVREEYEKHENKKLISVFEYILDAWFETFEEGPPTPENAQNLFLGFLKDTHCVPLVINEVEKAFKSKFRFEKHLYCTRMLCYTFCMFQLHRTLCLSSHQNAETTQNVLCTMPASTGSVSTPVL